MLVEAQPPTDDVVATILRAQVMAAVLGDEAPPAKIGRFTVLGRVGAGASGTVFAAYDETLDRKVAIKVLRQLDAGPDDLLPEARMLAKLRHPNIVAVHEAGELDGQVFVAMEFVNGGSLRGWLEAELRSSAETLEVLIAAGNGLHAAHEAGIAHGDFKPDNVLVGPDGPRVADFGLARSTVAPSQPGGGGTPLYMAPERLDGGPPSERADQFALAVTIVEALSGERPFSGSSLATLRLAMAEPPEIPPAVAGDRRLDAAVRRALREDPEARFGSVQEFVAALLPPPTRPWVRFALAGAVVVGFATVAALDGDPQDACEGGPALLAEAYPASARTALEDALVGELGDDAAAPTLARLDAYGQSWTETHHQACAATRIEGVQSDSMLDRRMACLMRRRTELSAVVDALSKVENTNEAARAAGAVDALVDLALCDAARLEDAPAIPEPGDIEDVQRLQAELAAGWADHRLARYGPALQRARTTDSAAATVDYLPLQAEAAFFLGTTEGRTAGLPEAEASLRRARELAAKARMRELASDISTQLLRAVMFSGKPTRVQDVVTLAKADALEAGRSLAEIEGIVAESRLKAGDPQGALDSIERALPEERRSPHRALLLVNRASAKLRLHDSAGALEDYQAAYELAATHYGASHPRMGFFLHRVGRGELGHGDAAGALQTLERALALREAVLGPEDRSVASVLVDLAEARAALLEPAAAEALLRRALKIRAAALGPEHPRTRELAERVREAAAPR